MDEQKHKKISYYVPQLGKVTVKLCEFPSKCYYLLEKEGAINRMNEIDQLGVIRSVYAGAHHPRWEYVMVQLTLVDFLLRKDPEKKTRKRLGIEY